MAADGVTMANLLHLPELRAAGEGDWPTLHEEPTTLPAAEYNCRIQCPPGCLLYLDIL